MKALVIYDSQFGNTEQIAQAIGAALEEYGQVRVLPVPQAAIEEMKGIELLAIGGPTQHHGLSPALSAFLDSIPDSALQGVAALSFDTRREMPAWLSGSAAGLIEKRLRKVGCKLLMPHESFFVAGTEGPLEDGEVQRAGEWVRIALEAAGYCPVGPIAAVSEAPGPTSSVE